MQQQWFHGGMSRIEAEALLEDNGEFLIRYNDQVISPFKMFCSHIERVRESMC